MGLLTKVRTGRPPGRPPILERKRILQRRRILELAQHRGACSVDAAVQFWVWTLNNGRVPWPYRNVAAQNLADRFGLPVVSATVNVDSLMGAPKTVTIRAHEAPPGFSEEPPPEVREAVEKWNRAEEARLAAERGNGDGAGPGGDGDGQAGGAPVG